MGKRSWGRLALLFAALIIVAYLRQLGESQMGPGAPAAPFPESRRPPAAGSTSQDQAGELAIAAAFRDRRSDVWVEASGSVEKLLRDDNEGARHQLMIVRLGSGQTVLISHNIDLAKRVPAREGDQLVFRGEYEWNERGGVVHWTHHDPQNRHAGGYLSHKGIKYR